MMKSDVLDGFDTIKACVAYRLPDGTVTKMCIRDRAYAMREFHQRGVKAVKMDEISRGLRVSKRTVYEIFGDKEELLLAGMKIERAEYKARVEEYALAHARNVMAVSYTHLIHILALET